MGFLPIHGYYLIVSDFYVTRRKSFAYVSFVLSEYFLLSFKVICFSSSSSKAESNPKKQIIQVFRINLNDAHSTPVTYSASLDGFMCAFT